MDNKRNLVIVGGGPAGMMAAVSARSHNANVTLIEKNACLGKKLLLTGGGRCNFTNLADASQYQEHFFHGGKFLRDAFNEFSNQDTLQFFKNNGVNYRVEDNGCVFPSTGRAESVLEVFKKKINQSQINLLFNRRLRKIIVKAGKVTGVQLDNNRILDCSSVILASGGVSYPNTGSNGEGLKIAKQLGHEINALRGGLVSLQASQKYVGNLEGLSIKGATFVFKTSNRKLKPRKGNFLFTNNGLSGPLALSSSSIITAWLAKSEKIQLTIDFYPNITKEILIERLKKEINLHPNKNIGNLLGTIVVQRLAGEIIRINKIDPTKKVSYITKAEMTAIIDLLKKMQLDIIRTGPIEKATVTQGGVSLKQVCPKTMESRIVQGLYFAGEILDIDGDCGGFNLQSAFSTGHCAGKHAAID
ncbi:MAG: NAD(P)/FAD-dependent oxidoreductase [Candidatus Omnitrophica bacterium]|nr:NAD(P)/FAD-dependent oxidoreductase [Candidatus Omnitrophota bacterium]